MMLMLSSVLQSAQETISLSRATDECSKMSYTDGPLEVFPPPHDFRSPIKSVGREAVYEFHGPLSPPTLATSASDFILQHCTGNRADLIQSLSTFIADSADLTWQRAGAPDQDASTHSTWLCVRITAASDEWITPRWHRDGRMFTCTCTAPGPHAKYAVTLLGPPTRLLCPSEDVDAVVRMAEAKRSERDNGSYEDDEDAERAELAATLKDMPHVELRRGQAIKFTWGEEDAPVHSEPDSSAEDRVFVSILFGSEEELRDMCHLRDKVYGEERNWISPRPLQRVLPL